MNFIKLLIIALTLSVGAVNAAGLTGPQQNAVRSANMYLSMMGFSR